ncbi:glycosyltransferase family 2 protein [Hyphomonas johnsonii]|uniref:Glycosyl transferase group 2 family protein n=1 Tax=Hyphomonas johnsonii MHS-2 TaxID=1280950 RepID=A0A059FLN6_9PROT|nr:glycosyltransferase family 2 protein [Hyphomonas johnsonii]KCZ91570.1 glycosyl transferase group 2 family protein [Hyphomonas johnsonii MHS-2]
MPTVSAIVVTYHTGPRLHECLYALRSDPGISETIIVDNGNPAESTAWIDRFVAGSDTVRLVRTGGNPGFGAGVNRGAAAALGDMLLVINPDAVIRRGSIADLLAALEDQPEPALVGGRIFDVSGREARGCRRNTLTLWRALGLGKWVLDEMPGPAGPVPVGAVSGAFFLMPRAAFEALHGFDEGYFMHVEDVDLCRRVVEAGGAVIYQPLAGALHYGSTSEVPSPLVQAHKARSLARYFRKFAKGPLERALVGAVSPLIGVALKLRG